MTLAHFISQLRFACAVLNANGDILCTSVRFAEIFGADHGNITAVFAKTPQIAAKVAAIFTDKTPITLRDISFGTNCRGDADLFPIFGSQAQLTGVAIVLFESTNDSPFADHIRRGDALARVSLIASGLAHEIKNPLSGLKGAAQLILGDLDDRKRLAEYAGIIARESERIDRLLRELLDFTKPRELKLTAVNANRVLHEAVLALRAGFPNITFHEQYDPSLPEVSGDADAITQVLMNLVKNAAEACSRHGCVTVRSHVVTDALLRMGTRKRQLICLQIEDDGCGMNEETVANIFTPYYTTKERGTGLGLAISHRLIELHGGSIGVKSATGRGTAFSVYLPVH